MFTSSVSVGFETLRANPLRTILSTLGVIIGVGALVSVLSLADGMERTARRQLDGTTDVQVLSVTANLTEQINGEQFPLQDTLKLSRDDWSAVSRFPGVSAAALVLNNRVELHVGDTLRRMASVTETVPAYDAIARVRLDAGRYFTDAELDSGAAVVVISSALARVVAPPSAHEDSIASRAIGREVTLGTQPRRVGIGIMNVLLASVTERTREIGIRKAASARHRDILLQFLAESVAVTSAGGVIGILLGLTISFGVTALIRTLADAPFIESSVRVSTILIAVLASVSIGLIFGTYPARRAARLSPIDAIRHE